MHIVFIEPCFPANQREFLRGLREVRDLRGLRGPIEPFDFRGPIALGIENKQKLQGGGEGKVFNLLVYIFFCVVLILIPSYRQGSFDGRNPHHAVRKTHGRSCTEIFVTCRIRPSCVACIACWRGGTRRTLAQLRRFETTW